MFISTALTEVVPKSMPSHRESSPVLISVAMSVTAHNSTKCNNAPNGTED
uniref:Uncharacterized protein n=1 Tax=Arion vulgaris TaxID=1028688 RepID=A0A0B6ZWB7_9EUPU